MVALFKSVPRATAWPLHFGAAVVAALPMSLGRPEYRFSISPAQEVRYALADARSLASPTSVRYLTLGHLTPEQAEQCIVAVNLALQSTSRVRAITPAIRISETVLRIDASAYVNDAKELDEWENAWASIAASDSYHHLQTQVIPYGQTKVQTVSVAGGWTGLDSEANLRAVTNTPTMGAILRADYFAAAALKPPAYYAFAGIPATETEFLKGFGIDEAIIERLEANAGANLHESGVTRKVRRVVWEQSPLGGIYSTFDSKIGDAFHNPFYRPISANGSAMKFDAKEYFAVGRNGFWITAIFDAAGKRLDAVDPAIASDYMAANDGAADVQVRSGYSCLRCHSTNGLNALTDDQTKLLQTKRGTATLSSYDGAYVRRVLGFYDEPRLQRQMDFDRATNAMAVARIGCTPAQATSALAATVKLEEYDGVTPEMAATELGTTVERFPQLIGQTTDPNLAALLESHTISRDAWKSCYSEAAVKRWSHP